jgi:MFS family permease
VWRFVPESPIKTPARLDVVGAVGLSAGLVCLLVAITEGESWGWSSPRVVGLLAAAAVVLVGWAVAETRFPDPLVDMRMLGEKTVLFTNLSSFLAGFGMYSLFVLVPKFAETAPAQGGYGFDASPTRAGLYLLPGALVMLPAGPAAGALCRRYGSRWALASGMLILAVGSAMFAEWNDRPWQLVVAMVVADAGIAWAFAAMSTLITEVVRPHETGIANGMNTVFRTVGGVVGGQAVAVLLVSHHLPGLALPARSGYVAAYTACAIGSLAGAFVAVLAAPSRPRARAAIASAD